ncbi:hypothetical protein PWT90_08255 [Aphanocladium album]|nr:hypothetical protein PWT90_08255 [Aphanocladium album]
MIDLPSLFFGAFVCAFAFTLIEICKQTRRIARRGRVWSSKNGYLYMIWIEHIVNLVFAVSTILYLNGTIHGSFAFYFGTVTLWTIQTQILGQIIANRVSLIMVSRKRAKWMRLGLFVLVLGVNIGVYVIWIPAWLSHSTPRHKRLNDIFEKFEKSFFLAVDLGLNLLFLYLVRFRLIAGGLPKYWALFKMNALLIVVSTAMDATLLGMLSLSDPYVYVQFAPLGYTVKLYVELVMAVLIAKIVSSEAVPGQVAGASEYPSFHPPAPMGYGRYPDKYGSTRSIFRDGSVMAAAPPTPKFDARSIVSGASSYYADIEGRCEAPGDEVFRQVVPPGASPETTIIKTVTTTVVSEDKNAPPPPPPPPLPCSNSVSRSITGSIKSHKSRLRAGAYDDWINDPAPPPPPPKDTNVSLKRGKSRRALQPLALTSRFNQSRR